MIRNFRDLHMYTNRHGKRLKEGMFLRSAALNALKGKDIAKLQNYAPLTVIDLRTEVERSERPDKEFDAYYAIPFLREAEIGISHDKESKKIIKSQLRVPNMPELYARIIDNENSEESFAQFFSILADPDREGAVLWHCSEGKDRCGTASALFLKMMDFDDQVIYEDYMKSKRSARKNSWLFFFLVLFFKWDPKMAIAVKRAFTVKPEYLESAFKAIDEKYGNFDSFLLAIGIDEEKKEQIKARCLE